MKILLLCKRSYTDKDLFKGPIRPASLHPPLSGLDTLLQLQLLTTRNSHSEEMVAEGVLFRTVPATFTRLFGLPLPPYRSTQTAGPDVIIASGDSRIGYIAMHLARRLRAQLCLMCTTVTPAFAETGFPA